MKQVGVVEAVLRRWDPIGVRSDQDGPTDEYDSYAPHIVSMVAQGCSLADLRAHLHWIRTVMIGVEANPERDAEVAGEILESLRTRAG